MCSLLLKTILIMYLFFVICSFSLKEIYLYFLIFVRSTGGEKEIKLNQKGAQHRSRDKMYKRGLIGDE